MLINLLHKTHKNNSYSEDNIKQEDYQGKMDNYHQKQVRKSAWVVDFEEFCRGAPMILLLVQK